MNDTRMRSPLGRAIGLGSAKEGVQHWWVQRLTAVALVPLAVWFVIVILELAATGADRAELVAWVRHPVPAAVWILLLIAVFYHAALGLQVIVEDYVGNRAARYTLLILIRLGAVLLGVLGIVAVVKLLLGG
ncbi:MAG TPA: succinate dehydrogenase, hydrophobic membrane anchor protein [Stellaceae bacterium]|nr:succinate dehydrogenase, hydrophobic membrane anchor protein [Stellaceae bacterium]